MSVIVASNLAVTLSEFCTKGQHKLAVPNIDAENLKISDVWIIVDALNKKYKNKLLLKLRIDEDNVHHDMIDAVMKSEFDTRVYTTINRYFQTKYKTSANVLDLNSIESTVNLSHVHLRGNIELGPTFTPRHEGFAFDALIHNYVEDLAELFDSGEVYVLYENFKDNYGFEIKDGSAEYKGVDVVFKHS